MASKPPPAHISACAPGESQAGDSNVQARQSINPLQNTSTSNEAERIQTSGLLSPGIARSAADQQVVFNNILIPESTMNLFFQRCDSPQDQFDGIESFMSRHLISLNSSPTIPAMDTEASDMLKRVTAFEDLLKDQASRLGEI
ncbi:hypothetical protein QAD02_019677 [Eretmocerus hayati]|uniref:Uncharacterized protein n=1 Tax=Eretmocerus hayati TaxID=131215 RepID=A0ACC2PKE3_9HYME|nr:hypothetical protein QAD02_019677 [Eretmocerus hayati]